MAKKSGVSLVVGAAAIQHTVREMLADNDIHGVAHILPDLTFGQALQILDDVVVFEGDTSQGIRLVEKPAD